MKNRNIPKRFGILVRLTAVRLNPLLPRREVRFPLNNRDDKFRQLLLLQDTCNHRSSLVFCDQHVSRDTLTFIQHGLRRTGSEEQHLIVRVGTILEPQTSKVRPAFIVEIPKLHPVIVLIRDDLPQ
jgi:hypothetical protein